MRNKKIKSLVGSVLQMVSEQLAYHVDRLKEGKDIDPEDVRFMFETGTVALSMLDCLKGEENGKSK